MQSWKTLGRSVVLDYNRFLTVERHTVELPDGRIIDDWAWIRTPDYVNVLASTVEGDYLCFRQVKYGIQGASLAPVGGMLEPGEDPLQAAKRELREETGFRAEHWQPLGQFRTDANRGVGIGYLFLASGAWFAGAVPSDELEEQALVRLRRAELQAALLAGEFKVLSWATTVALALLHTTAEHALLHSVHSGGEP